MKTSKFLFSTLIAAAAMSSAVYAATSVNGITWEDDMEAGTRTFTGTATGYVKINGSGQNEGLNGIGSIGTLVFNSVGGTGNAAWFAKETTVQNIKLLGTGLTIKGGTTSGPAVFTGNLLSGTEGASFTWNNDNAGNQQTFRFEGDLTAFNGSFSRTTATTGNLFFGKESAGVYSGTAVDGVISNISGTGSIDTSAGVIYNYTASDTYSTLSIGNSSITAKTLTFQGGASYAVNTDVAAGTLTLAVGSLTLNRTTTVSSAINNSGSLTLNGTTTVSSAINNSGTITFGEGAALALTGIAASSFSGLEKSATGLQTVGSIYTIATGEGTVSGLTASSVTINGAVATNIAEGGKTATISNFSVYNIGTNDSVDYSGISSENLAAAGAINVAGTLNYGTTSSGGTLDGGKLSGDGLVTWENTNVKHGTTISISDGFSGTLQLTGNITSGNELDLGGTQNLVLGGVWFWGQSVSTINAAVVLGDSTLVAPDPARVEAHKNSHFYVDGSGINFTNSFNAEGKTVYLAGGTTTFGGDTKIGTLNLSGGSATISGSISADLKKIGSGTLTVSGSVENGSTLEIAEGTASINTLQARGATIKVSGGNLSFSGSANESFNANLEIGGGESSVVVNAGWTDQVGRDNSGESYIKVGKNGEFAMGDKRWGLVSNKKVILENGGKITGTVVGSGNGSYYGNLDFDGKNTISATGEGNEISAGIRLRTGTLTFDVDADSDLTFSGVFNPAEKTTRQNGIIKSGAGTLTLSGDNSEVNYGTTTISQGKLVAAHANALGTGALTNDAELELAFDGTLGSGSISGTGSVVVNSTGTVTLSKANSYTGGTTISQGKLVAAHANALGTGNVTVGEGATLSLGTDAVSVENLRGDGYVEVNSSVGDATLTINSTEASLFKGQLTAGNTTRSLSLIKTGTEKFSIIGGNYNLVHSLEIREGTLVTSGADALVSEEGYSIFGVKPTVSVHSGANLEVSVSGGTLLVGELNLAKDAKIIANLEGVEASGEKVVLNIVAATAINMNWSANQVAMLSDLNDINNYVDFTGNDALLATYVNQTWSYAYGVLSLTLAIPEPSLFGLLAGLGALTLVGTRRRRGKKA